MMPQLFRRSLLCIVLVVSASGAQVLDSPPPRLTPAQARAARSGAPFRKFAAWLDAFNAADRDRLQQSLSTPWAVPDVDGQLAFRKQTGGFDLRALEQATPTTLIGLIQERRGDRFGRFSLTIDTVSQSITTFPINAIPRPPDFPIARLAESELAPALRATLDRDAAADRFAGAALVARIDNGAPKVLFTAAYGLADRKKRIANTLDTRFRLGSMNKMFTAVSILQLVQAGKIKFTDPVGKYITDYPNQEIATKVTIHQLLTRPVAPAISLGPSIPLIVSS
jgi:D-alanyl-D-alanine carboxypeptidase